MIHNKREIVQLQRNQNMANGCGFIGHGLKT